MLDKKELRKAMIKNRDNLNLDEREVSDKLILQTLIKSDVYKKSTNIFTFINYGSEVETKEFINIALNEGKNIFVPKTVKGTRNMKAVKINSLDNLKPDNWGILEPESFNGEIDKENLDLVIVPGVIFDRDGNRMGYGGGYYDIYFANLKSKVNKIALAYDIQVIEYLLTEEHDVSVDAIITEKEMIKIKKSQI